MRHPLTLLAALLFCSASLHAQTIRTIGYNTTNGQVVANTGTNVLTFTNTAASFQKILLNGSVSDAFPFSAGIRLAQGTNSIFNGFSWDGQYNGHLTYHHNVLGVSSEPEFRVSSTEITVFSPIVFSNGAATTRTNLGLGSGITTNRTFVSYNGTNYTTNSVSISNGIITGWTQ